MTRAQGRRMSPREGTLSKRFIIAASLMLVGGRAWGGEPEVRTLEVPVELARVTSNPEPSGIVWSPTLRRYLVVSDDTGYRSQGTRHAAWLLGLEETGRFDNAPIPIRGVEAVDDAESICAGPAGTYFVVTSHSPNHDNKTSAARRQLLHLREDSDKLVLIARADLSRILATSLLKPASMRLAGRLDIEAVSYRAGALFIGLKSPLSERGEAVILRITDAVARLRQGKLNEGAIERFGAFPLCVPAGKRSVCQGISDMTFLPDDSLVVTANAPKGSPTDHGGALWYLPIPVGVSPPVLLHRFAHLKPEGVTLSPTSKSLVIVFDRDHRPGQWTEVPLPRPQGRTTGAAIRATRRP